MTSLVINKSILFVYRIAKILFQILTGKLFLSTSPRFDYGPNYTNAIISVMLLEAPIQIYLTLSSVTSARCLHQIKCQYWAEYKVFMVTALL